MKKFRYLMEAVILWLSFQVFSRMRSEKASALGGWIGRTFGSKLKVSDRAMDNLQRAMPGKTVEEYKSIIAETWENLGRLIAEYPHLQDIIMNRTEIVGEENILNIGKDKSCVVISAHNANWELGSFYFNYKLDWPMSGIFRTPNNPYTEKLLDACRNPEQRGTYIPKSQKGAKAMIKTLKGGGRLGILIDQKYNQGVAVPFFGRPAMTSDAFAVLSKKFDVPIIPLQVERLPDCRFRITLHTPFRVGDMNEIEIITKAHTILEGWIRKNPGQWLWLHRRWGKNPESSAAPK